jgi:hypothetical protein
VARGRKAPAVGPLEGIKAQCALDLAQATETLKNAVAEFEATGSQDDRQRLDAAIVNVMIKARESHEN